MRRLAFLLALLLCVSADAKVLRRAGTVAVVECPSPVTKINQNSGALASHNSYDTNTMGQTFTPAATYDLYSITISVNTVNTVPVTVTMRLDDDADMSSEYIEQAQAVVTATGTAEFFFTGTPTLTNGTLYYITVNTPDFAGRILLNYDNANPLANATYRYGNVTAFVLNTEETGYDIYIVVKSCS